MTALFCTTFGFAQSASSNKVDYSNKNKGEQTYTNGPFISVATTRGFLSAGYYLGPNNLVNAYVSVIPFQQTFVSTPANQDNSWTTSIAAGSGVYLPLARKKLQNKLFILNEALWVQTFGQSLSSAGKINSSWLVAWVAGLQYRISPSIYFSFKGPIIAFNRANYRDAIPSAFFPTTQSIWTYSILTQGTAAIEYKF